MENICSLAGTGMESSLTMLVGVASLATIMIISISYMLGNVLSNPKVTLWAKTEIVQLIVSLASIFIIFVVLQSFCVVDFNSLHSLTNVNNPVQMSGNLFDAAEAYLLGAANYTHTILEIQRYHQMAFNMMLMRGRYDCIYGALFCLFGNAGTSSSPYSWVSVTMGAMSVVFNTTLIAYISSLVALFILFYATSGFALFFLPLGIFFRSLPYLRSLGSLFITIVFSFVIVYPLILSIFYLSTPILFDYIDPAILNYSDPQDVVDKGGSGDIFLSMWDWGDDDYSGEFFNSKMDSLVYQLGGRAFIVGVFIPLIALLGTVASVNYAAKLLGEEIDLSKIVRLV
ncbi:MAG: hypothetical protein PHU63_01720 [Candidatus ainarchaeum sp.]|nr:hypothetical protein [Candidatus ainarchaeum sp.]